MTRILIADDQQVWLNLLKVELERNPGYQVCGQAVDGVQLVAMALELRPDVVIVDLVMPGMNGLDAAREIACRLAGTDILMYTFTDALTLVAEASKAGIQSVIQKQQGVAPLLNAIETVRQKRQASPPVELPLSSVNAPTAEAAATNGPDGVSCPDGNPSKSS